MPMYKRMIVPVEVSRNAVDKGVRNELECVSNNTLANLLLQLSSLSKMSEDLFTEIHLETCCVFYRTCQIIKRVEALKYKIIQLNPIAEEVSLRDITQREPFSSTLENNQEIITIATRPRAINDMYLSIEKPPCLHILDPYREDGKKSIKFYTDPGYFFELWQKQMAVHTEVQLKKKNAKVKRKTSKRLLDEGKSPSSTHHPPAANMPLSLPVYPQQQQQQPQQHHHNGDVVNLQQLQQQQQSHQQQQLQQQQQEYEYEQQLMMQQQQQAYQLFNSDQQSAWNTGHETDQVVYGGQAYVEAEAAFPPQPPSPPPPPFHQAHPPAKLPPDTLPDFPLMPDSTDNFCDLLPPPPIFPDASFDTSLPLPPSIPPPMHSSSGDLNDSFMPSPPQHLPPPSIQGEGVSFKFSAGVEELLSRIEGTHLISRDNTPLRPSSTDHALNHSDHHSTSPPHHSTSPHHNSTPPHHHPVTNLASNSLLSPSMENGVVANQQAQQPHTQQQQLPQQQQQQQTKQQPSMLRDNRSDLLSAIRTGIQLRKVAETKQQKKRRTTGRLDVQTIMEAAFEVRRKAMEGDDEEEEEDEEGEGEEGAWSD